jgi:metallo-beta-lactamase family protein
VYCTAPTADLCALLLPDSGHLQEEDARYANERGFSRHSPALPLYTEADARRSLKQFESVRYDVETEVAPGIGVSLTHTGHILGSAAVRVATADGAITFTGDVGRPGDSILKPPAPLATTDWLVVESTYGDRRHPTVDPADQLADVIRRTAARGGVVVIPAFAVGRAQTLLHLLHRLKRTDAIPASLPAYLDSPMAVDATEIYRRHSALHRLDASACREAFGVATVVNTSEDSKALDRRRFPMVIIAASGMATGGRVLHHLKAFAPDRRNTILLSGFQAPGTRGASLVEGARSLRIHGHDVPIEAEVATLENLSAHADHAEIIEWLRASPARPSRTFVTHGEPGPADAMRQRLRDALGWHTEVPEYQSVVELATTGRSPTQPST